MKCIFLSKITNPPPHFSGAVRSGSARRFLLLPLLALALLFSGCGIFDDDGTGKPAPDSETPLPFAGFDTPDDSGKPDPETLPPLAGFDTPDGSGKPDPETPPLLVNFDSLTTENRHSLKAKFGLAGTGTEAVKTVFNTLHKFIRLGGLESVPGAVELGDWIDLEGGLEVKAYPGEDTNGGGYFKYEEASEYTRLVVVGINMFQSSDTPGGYAYSGDDTPPPHVVFHFQNIPVMRRMNKDSYNEGGVSRERDAEVSGAGWGGRGKREVPCGAEGCGGAGKRAVGADANYIKETRGGRDSRCAVAAHGTGAV
jgi:hypothetical protein